MAKRSRDDESDAERLTKRTRSTTPDRLSALSDELLLRTLSYLPLSDLNVCQGVSQKYKSIAADSQLWKSLYYNRFVRPRASRLPGMRDTDPVPGHLVYSSKLSKWLDEENLVKRGQETNWKRQYKLRHNWSKGSCNVNEIEVAESPPLPPLLLRMHDSIVYTVDLAGGLRAWATKSEKNMLAVLPFESTSAPTSMAIDASEGLESVHSIAVGFEDGSFTVYDFDKIQSTLKASYQHPPSSNGMLSAVALCSPYLVTMTAAQLLSLYKF